MTLPPIQRGGGMDIPPARPPLLTAPVLTGVPPLVDETELLLTGQPRTAGPRASGAPTPQPAPLPLRDDAPISLGGTCRTATRSRASCCWCRRST